MCVAAGIDQKAHVGSIVFVEVLHQLAFDVTLEVVQLNIRPTAVEPSFPQGDLHGQGLIAIQFRLALAKLA